MDLCELIKNSAYNSKPDTICDIILKLIQYRWLISNEYSKSSASRGYTWLLNSFKIFKRSPWEFIGAGLASLVLMMIVAIIPIVNLLSGFVQVGFMIGFLVGINNMRKTGKFEFKDIFLGFDKKS